MTRHVPSADAVVRSTCSPRSPSCVADGATGTNYQDMGIEPGVAPEEWVFDAPDNVRELHRRFFDAGSDLVLTCTFGATTPRLADGPLAGRTRELNMRAAELAREAAGADRLVAGSMGPTGQLVEPYGLLTREACVDGVRRAGARARGRRRRPARARDVLRARGGALGDRGRAERRATCRSSCRSASTRARTR